MVSPNRELVAFGAANLLGSIFGAFPTFASLARSSVVDTVRQGERRREEGWGGDGKIEGSREEKWRMAGRKRKKEKKKDRVIYFFGTFGLSSVHRGRSGGNRGGKKR